MKRTLLSVLLLALMAAPAMAQTRLPGNATIVTADTVTIPWDSISTEALDRICSTLAITPVDSGYVIVNVTGHVGMFSQDVMHFGLDTAGATANDTLLDYLKVRAPYYRSLDRIWLPFELSYGVMCDSSYAPVLADTSIDVFPSVVLTAGVGSNGDSFILKDVIIKVTQYVESDGTDA